MTKRTDRPGLGSLAAGALTASSMLVVSGVAAAVAVVIAREFGRTEETDGFFAAYGLFIVVTLAAQAIRISVLPRLAAARAERRLAAEIAGFAAAMAIVALPLVLVAELAAGPLGELLTGGSSDEAAGSAAAALRWMVPAAVAYLFAGLAASGLAALDDYATAALGYALGSAAGLTVILLRVEPDGIVAVAWGIALNGTVSLLVPSAALVVRALAERMPRAAVRPVGPSVASRLGGFFVAASLPVALQMLYVLCLPFAGTLGEGALTSFGYAYVAAATLVTITAFSLGLVTSVPLTRVGIDPERAARHVVASSWIALTVVAAAAGVLALAGAGLVEAVLGSAYGDEIGGEVARLVVVLTPWMVVSVGVNVAFPLAFVAGRLRPLPWIGLAALAAQVALAWLGAELLELDGLAVALAITTTLVLAALLAALGALGAGSHGIALAAASVSALALAAFLPPALVLAPAAGAVVGVAAYGALVALTRPPGLRASWAYLRALR